MDKQFTTSIKKKYQERLINRDEEWLPCRHSNKLIRLELVERNKGEGYCANVQRGREGDAVKRTPLAYGDLFKVESEKRPVRKVLVEGDAGIGKTTLCIAVSEDWANGKLFQQFELVLHLPLRMNAVASAVSLPVLLKILHSSPSLCDSVARYLEEKEGESVLIIADGWDELSESKQKGGSFLYHLLFEDFPFMSVIVTSRPSASASLHKLSCIDRFVEVQGFSKRNIKEYIESEFASNQRKAASLLEQLERNPLVESVCSIPLNCAIVCHLWRTLEEALPTTMTKLYTKIILNVVLRNIRKAGVCQGILSLTNFDTLPADLQEPWWYLCEFAYQALKRDRLVFSQEELVNFFPQGLALSENILCFGLLQSTESIFDVGYGVSFHFLHFTFQEYLAALHLARTLADGQLSQSNQCMIDHKASNLQKRFAVVWRFLFGIYFNVLGCNDYAPLKPYLSYNKDDLGRCHCAFEARNAVTNAIVNSFYKERFCSYSPGPSTAHDCAAILYVIGVMQECPDMGISFRNCHIGENQIKILTESLYSKAGKLQVVRLNLDGNKLSYESLNDLLHRASSAFQSFQSLSLRDSRIEPEKIVMLLAKPSCRAISFLDLSGINLGILGLLALEYIVSDGCLTNVAYLNLSGCLTDDINVYATALVTFLKSLSAHCRHLESLDLSDNDLGVPGASALATTISQHNNTLPTSYQRESLWLRSIYLNNTKLGDEGLRAFIENLESPYIFDNIYLQKNSIHATGLTCLAKWLKNNVNSGEIEWDDDDDYSQYFCESLDLKDNPLGIEAIIIIGEILGRCEQSHVKLAGCHLTRCPPGHDVIFREVGKQLCQMSKSSISHLDLSGNCFSGEYVCILAGFMCLCESLSVFYCRDCNIASEDLIQLLEIIVESKVSYPDLCNELCLWNLDSNEIDDRGVSALMNYVTLFPKLGSRTKFRAPGGIHLDGNPVNMDGVERLKTMLRQLSGENGLVQSSRESLSTCSSDESAAVEINQAVEETEQKDSLHLSPQSGVLPEAIPILISPSPCQPNNVIDFGHDGVSKHLGQIADAMYEWEGPVAEQLGLTQVNIADIKMNHPNKLGQQTRAALEKWKQMHGSNATYNNLIGVFERAGYSGYADTVRSIFDTSESVADFQTPATKRQCTSTSLCCVEHHLVDLVRWKEQEDGAIRDLEINSSRTHKWMESTIRLRFKQRDTQSTEEDRGNESIVTAASGSQGRVGDASDSSNYPKSRWELNNLLEDAKLGEIAKELSGIRRTE